MTGRDETMLTIDAVVRELWRDFFSVARKALRETSAAMLRSATFRKFAGNASA